MKLKMVMIAAAALMLAMPIAAWSSRKYTTGPEDSGRGGGRDRTEATEAETAAGSRNSDRSRNSGRSRTSD